MFEVIYVEVEMGMVYGRQFLVDAAAGCLFCWWEWEGETPLS